MIWNRLCRSLGVITGRATRKAEAAVKGASHTAEELFERRTEMEEQIPDRSDIEDWFKVRAAEVRNFVKPPELFETQKLDVALNGVLAAIQQNSDKKARRLTGIVTAKAGGVAAASGITGLISAFGTASTGTAIGGLSGAAATTAQLYWLGSIIGGGVVAGGFILGGAALTAGVGGAYLFRHFWFGRERKPEQLEDYERSIVAACLSLAPAIAKQIAMAQQVRNEDMRTLAEIALLPIVHQIDMHRTAELIRATDEPNAKPISKTLSYGNQRKLDHHRDALCKIMVRAMG